MENLDPHTAFLFGAVFGIVLLSVVYGLGNFIAEKQHGKFPKE
jgi:hypothetical protein